jgi:hypothetical protein
MRAVQVNCGRWLPLSDWDRFATSKPAFRLAPKALRLPVVRTAAADGPSISSIRIPDYEMNGVLQCRRNGQLVKFSHPLLHHSTTPVVSPGQSSPIKPNRAIFMPPPSKIRRKCRDLRPQPVVSRGTAGIEASEVNQRQIQPKNQAQSSPIKPNQA